MSSLEKFLKTIEAIRDPKTGCVWNLAQNHSSLKRYLLEELYESLSAIDSIENGDNNAYQNLAEELGDLFLQIVLHAKIAEEKGHFTLDDVFDSINTKMIKRHPHVFKENLQGSVNKISEVDKHWDAEKAKEKKSRFSIFEGIPLELPALTRAWLISKKAVKESFEWDEEFKLFEQLNSELKEFDEVIKKARANGNDPHIEAFRDADLQKEAELELGDILFTIVNIARWYKLDPEEALRKTNNKFVNRFNKMMDIAKSQNKKLQDYNIDELESLWKQAKNLV